MADFDDRTFSVAELCQAIQIALGITFPGEVWVRGEIHDLKRPPSGHVYFDLVDAGELGRAMQAKLSVALFMNNKFSVNAILKRAGGGVRMTDGVEVRLRATLDFHAPSGQLKLVMTSIDPAYTLGRLAADRDRLLRQLSAEGLLTRNAQLPVPVVPLRIGLITSGGSAAQHDFLHELQQCGLGFTIIAADTRMQGTGSVEGVVQALTALTDEGVDLIAIVRGGGARTDLATFDHELLVRAIAGATVPIWTGIGHEIDSSLADEVAHSAFKTPTACAAAIVDRVAGFLAILDQQWAAVAALATHRLGRADAELVAKGRRLRHETAAALRLADERLDEATRLARRAAEQALRAADRSLEAKASLVAALDPARTLARGWSITRTTTGQLVRDPGDAPLGSSLVTTLATGTIRSRVKT